MGSVHVVELFVTRKRYVCEPAVKVVDDHVNVPLPGVIACQTPFNRVNAAVRGGLPVQVTVKWKMVAVVPLGGDTLPV